jgi:hypothetical protein
MKRLTELADQAPIDLRELLIGLDDEPLSEPNIPPMNSAGLLDYTVQNAPSGLDEISALFKVEPDTEIQFSDLPFTEQIKLGVSDEGEFVETQSDFALKTPARFTFKKMLDDLLPRFKKVTTAAEYDDWVKKTNDFFSHYQLNMRVKDSSTLFTFGEG